MSYTHYIFVSYRQVEPWKGWVRDIFVPALQARVVRDLPSAETVYSDDQLIGGTTWQTALNLAIWASRVIVPVFMTRYFESENCRQELAHMRRREEVCGFRSAQNADGLIVPIRLSATKFFPDAITGIQTRDFTRFGITNLRENTPVYYDFQDAMDLLFTDIVQAIDRAKPCDPDWSKLDAAQYEKAFEPKPLIQAMPRVMAA